MELRSLTNKWSYAFRCKVLVGFFVGCAHLAFPLGWACPATSELAALWQTRHVFYCID